MRFETVSEAYRALDPTWRWPNFSIPELACRCCGRFCKGEYWHAPAFLDRLQNLRDAIGAPLRLTSAHRCDLWNAAIGGAPASHHKRLAVDIDLTGHDRQALLSQAKAHGFRGFGMAKTFLHLDLRPVPASWYYKGSASLWQT
ncbi:MAG: D-Ala-D-Ala carboxypeptidase family metallohydrolase [Pseudomonadota bacterium]